MSRYIVEFIGTLFPMPTPLKANQASKGKDMRGRMLLLTLAAAAAMLCAVPTRAVEDLKAEIDYLLEFVRTCEVVFIRNGKEHTPEEAAEHMQRKYEHFQDEIRTAEDFIRLTATQSLLTRQPYRIRLGDGTTVPTATWLEEALAAYRRRGERDAGP